MGASRIPAAHRRGAVSDVEAQLRADGLQPRTWSNAPGDVYGEHQHDYHKRLVCVNGSITFHIPGGDVSLRAGDRLELEPRTPHSATVGPDGVTCVEAPVPP